MPAVGSAIERYQRACRIVRMVDVASHITGEQNLLAPVREPTQVPASARKCALGILALDSENRKAVGLKLE